MSRKCTNLFIRLFLLLFPFAVTAQSIRLDTLAFYHHLAENNLQREQIAFNNLWIKQRIHDRTFTDSMYLNNAVLYYKLNLMDLSDIDLAMVSGTNFNLHSEQLYISMLIIHSRLDEVQNILDSPSNGFTKRTRNDAQLSVNMLLRKNIVIDTTRSTYSTQIKEIAEHYEQAPHHSPVLAGLYSAVVPGLGKLYLGYKYQALSAFMVNMLLAGQSAESYARAGPRSFRFIASTTLFGFFYGGNILGSILSAKKQRHDYYKQLDHEILDFHTTIVGKPLY